MAGSGAPERRPVHGRPGHRNRERGVAFDSGRPWVLAGEPAMGNQRVRARLRRLPAPRREGGRPARAPSHLPPGRGRVHRRLAPGRPGLVRVVADRGARAAGSRCGDHHPGRALDPLDDLRRGEGAQHRARGLGRGGRLRRRRRRPAGRDPHRRAQLGVDLLRQRPRRRRPPSCWRRSCWPRAATPA